MRLYTIKTDVVETGDSISEVVLEALKGQGLQLKDGDILALTSKIVACAEGHLAKLSEVKASEKAKELAKKFSLQPEFAELILREADRIYGGVEKAILTLKNGVLTANAGVDNKNAPFGFAVFWPHDIQGWAKRIRDEVLGKTGRQVGFLIVDSGLVPLRVGTCGLALAVAGFKPVIDCRGERDIFGKPLVITRRAVADDLASAAHLLMGEAAEKTPVVLIRDAPVVFDDGIYGSDDMMLPFSKCIFMSVFLTGSHK
jgi:coenzyme F420-0:L-glutamate ligase/coenzyme F420-1:gamma-L-glutamate ligase